MNLDWLYEDKCKGCLFLQEDNIMGATCHWCKFKNEQINVDKVSQCEHKFTLKEAKEYKEIFDILNRILKLSLDIGEYEANGDGDRVPLLICDGKDYILNDDEYDKLKDKLKPYKE